MVSKDRERVMVCFKKEIVAKLRDYADRYGLSLSSVVQLFCINELDQKGKRE